MVKQENCLPSTSVHYCISHIPGIWKYLHVGLLVDWLCDFLSLHIRANSDGSCHLKKKLVLAEAEARHIMISAALSSREVASFEGRA